MLAVVGFLRCVAVWFVVALPFSPSVRAVYRDWSFCFSAQQRPFYPDPGMCLLNDAFIAPFAVIFGPLAGTVDDPINPWPAVLATALLLAVLLTTLSFFVRTWKD